MSSDAQGVSIGTSLHRGALQGQSLPGREGVEAWHGPSVGSCEQREGRHCMLRDRVCWKGLLPTSHFHLPSLQGEAGLQASRTPCCSSASTEHMDLDPGLSLDPSPPANQVWSHRSPQRGQQNSWEQWLRASHKPWQTSRDSWTEWIMANHMQPISQPPQSSSRASPGPLLHWLGVKRLLLPSPFVHRGYQGNLLKKKKPTRRVRKPTV